MFFLVLDYDPETQKLLKQDFQDPEASPGLWEGDIAGITPDVLFPNLQAIYGFLKLPSPTS